MFCSKCGVENNDSVNFCKGCGGQVKTNPTVQPVSQNVDVVLPASMLRRFINFFVDRIAVYVFAGVVLFSVDLVVSGNIAIILAIIAYLFYHFIFEALFQRTIGKLFTRTKVVDMEGNKPSLLKLFGRTLSRYIPFEPLSFLFGAYPVGWHDKLSKTMVVSSDMTPDQVKSIDLVIARKEKHSSGAMIVGVIVGGLFAVSIIGILSSVVLASLNVAREKGQDALVQSNLSNFRFEAELYFDDNLNSYSGLCNNFKAKNLLTESAEIISGNTFDYVCNDTKDGYAATVPLNTGDYYCVDNGGSAYIVGNKLFTQTRCSQASDSFNSTGNTSSSNSLYLELKEAAEYATSILDLPAMIDEETRFDRIYVSSDNKMNYDYSLVNFTVDELEWSVFEDNLLPILKNSFCNDIPFEYYRDENVPMKWNYYDMNKRIIGFIELSSKDCI